MYYGSKIKEPLSPPSLVEILQGALHALQDAYDRLKTRRAVLDGHLQRLEAIAATMAM